MPKENKKTDNKLLDSFNCALKGFVYAMKNERNMRIHIITALLVLIVSLFMNISRFEFLAIIFAIALVLITETINTSLELTVNLVTKEHHPLAEIIKDLSAAAVFLASLCAIAVGYIVFIRKDIIEAIRTEIVLEKIIEFSPHITLLIMIIVIATTVLIKIFTEKNPSLEGGMPSIHTAVAFALAWIAYFVSSSKFVLLITLFLAAMIGHSRISKHIHSIWEVVAGAILGILISVLFFQLLL